MPIGTLDGCTVFACFDGDGDMYQASLTWRGFATDGSSYVGLPHGEEVGCTGDIGFTDWLILSAATKAGILDALITLAQQHNHIDVIAGTARSELGGAACWVRTVTRAPGRAVGGALAQGNDEQIAESAAEIIGH